MSKALNENIEVIVMAGVAVVALVPLILGIVGLSPPGEGEFLDKPTGESTACVRDTEYMRLHHMDLLKAMRAEGVREGNRGDVEFRDCMRCHTSREKFCDKCHKVVNLNPDCFQCHYYPK
jgi:hypothetical protein